MARAIWNVTFKLFTFPDEICELTPLTLNIIYIGLECELSTNWNKSNGTKPSGKIRF